MAMSGWWLFIGTFLVCSGIGTPAGIIILVIYFWDDLRKNLKFSQHTDNTFNINNLNLTSDPRDFGKDDFDTPMDHMSRDTKEDLR